MTPGENIQRWGWWVDPETGKPAIVKSAHGDYVLASEHEARIAELESEIAEALPKQGGLMNRPTVTTLCGSTRFPDAFELANLHLSMEGRIVISLGMFGHTDKPVGSRFLTSDGDESTPEKKHLDQLHFRKIDISDGIFVINPGHYLGSSTRREVSYARSQGKTVEWMFAPTESELAAVAKAVAEL